MKIVLVDATNNYLRNYAVVPTLDMNGERNGGVYGMLTTLSYLTRTLDPDKMILCWDGPGGSKKRREILSEYKDGRVPIKPARINANFDFELENIYENKIKQRKRLAEYLHDLPLHEVIVQDIEADDVIGYLVQYYNDAEKLIVSSDKDFYQLLDDKTTIFKPKEKVFVRTQDIFDKFKIYPRNFAVARSITGDASDNISGVKSVGLKNILKYFPFISDDREVKLAEIFDFCREQIKTKAGAKYQKFLDAEKVVIDNLKVVQLKDPIISVSSISQIKNGLDKPVSFNGTPFRMKLLEDGITQLGDPFFRTFKLLEIKGRNNGE